MRQYFMEDDENIEMDVQVGPEREVDVDVDADEAVPTPVDIAKANVANIPVAAVAHDNDDPDAGNDVKVEFYVDLSDVEKYADLNEMTMIDALNSIIEFHQDAGMGADNMVVLVSESNVNYARNLEKHGAAYQFIKEADDIEMDVQVGPNGEEMHMQADPQEANPVDAIKREYDNVVVAKQGDDFFVDVEDVQKCADLNCESVIATLNGIISCNEATGMSAENVIVLCDEFTSMDTIDAFDQCGVLYEARFELPPKFSQDPALKKYICTVRAAERLLNSEGEPTRTSLHKFGDIALRILDIIMNAYSVVLLPFCLCIAPIPVYLFYRLCSWGLRAGRESVVIDEGEKILAKLDKVIKNTTDKELKNKLIEQKEKITARLEKLDDEDY